MVNDIIITLITAISVETTENLLKQIHDLLTENKQLKSEKEANSLEKVKNQQQKAIKQQKYQNNKWKTLH